MLVACSENSSHRILGECTCEGTEQSVAANQIRTLFFSQNESAAVRIGDNLLASSPQSTRFFAWYVTSLAKTGKLDVAYSKAASLLKDQPDSKWAQFAIAGVLMWSMPKTGNGKEIENAARIAYEKDRGNPDFLWSYAESLRLVGDGNAALSLLDENEHIAAEGPDLMNVRAAILAKKTIQSNFVTSDLLSAVSESERIRSLAPENVNAYYYPGLLLLQAGYPNKAEELLLVATKYSSGYRVVAAYWEAIRAQDTLSLSEKRKRVEQSVRMLLTNDYIDRNLLVLAAEHYADLEMPEARARTERTIRCSGPFSDRSGKSLPLSHSLFGAARE